MQTELKFAGFGGQGILLSAKLMAYAAMKQGFFVAWVPSYGPEMRGGTAYCTVVIGDKRIGSPIIKNPTHLVAMNRPSLEKFANDIAIKAGSVRAANIVALSAFAAKADIVDMELLKDCVKKEFAAKPKIIPLNMKAFDDGVNIANNS